MACDQRVLPGETAETRARDVKIAIERLRVGLAARSIQVVISPTGAVAFKRWQDADRGRISDVCAYRILQAANSPELRRAVAAAEAIAGRKIDARQVAAGVHSHDNGQTWGPGHG